MPVPVIPLALSATRWEVATASATSRRLIKKACEITPHLPLSFPHCLPPCRKLMSAYCNKSSIDPESVAFMFEGNRLRGEQTPQDVDMEDDDEIQVLGETNSSIFILDAGKGKGCFRLAHHYQYHRK